MKVLHTFVRFIKHPHLKDSQKLNWRQSIEIVVKSILIYYVFLLLSAIYMFPLEQLRLLPESRKSISEYPLSVTLLIFAPFWEELIFRLPMKYSKHNLFVSITLFLFLQFRHEFNIYLLSVSIAIIYLIGVCIFSNRLDEKIADFTREKFPFYFYSITFLFGFIHLFNYRDLTLVHFLLFPFLISPQLFMGLILGYLRVYYKGGFIYSVFVHGLINLPIILLSKI